MSFSSCSPTQWWHFTDVKWWHFCKSAALLEQRDARLPLHLRWSSAGLQRTDGVWLFSLSFIWGRMGELFCPGPISPRWGVLTKCLAYSKAASDPFVYSLLRHQYRKTCSLLANKILRRGPLNSSSNTSNVNATSDLQAPVNKTVDQWGWTKAGTSLWHRTTFGYLKNKVTDKIEWFIDATCKCDRAAHWCFLDDIGGRITLWEDGGIIISSLGSASKYKTSADLPTKTTSNCIPLEQDGCRGQRHQLWSKPMAGSRSSS